MINQTEEDIHYSRGYAHCLSNVMDWLLELEEQGINYRQWMGNYEDKVFDWRYKHNSDTPPIPDHIKNLT